MQHKLIVTAVILIGVFVFDCSAQASPACKKIRYENNNQIDPRPMKLKKISGTVVLGQDNSPLSWGACVGLFDEKTKKRISTTATRGDGSFVLRNIAPGKYRLVVTDEHGAYCKANIPVVVTSAADRSSKILVTMRGSGEGGMHSCSSGRVKGAMSNAVSAEDGGVRETLNDGIIVSISTDSSSLTRGRPFWVRVKIENRTDKALLLNRVVGISLDPTELTKKAFGKAYSFISNFAVQSDVEPKVRKKSLNKDARIEFKVDIAKLWWGHANQAHIPIDQFFDLIPKEEYELYFEVLAEEIMNNEKNTVYTVYANSNTKIVTVR